MKLTFLDKKILREQFWKCIMDVWAAKIIKVGQAPSFS